MSSPSPKIAITIQLKALPGKAGELTELLIGAAALVKKTEPKTLYWYVTRLNNDTFVISDGFADAEGVQAHFEGKVATTLKEKSGDLLVGGWEQGVLANIIRSDIISTIG